MQQERLTNTFISLFLVSWDLRGFSHIICVYDELSLDRFSSFPTLVVPPSIRGNSGDAPVVVNALVGKSITLQCESNAVPPPNIIWYKNGRVLTESANLQILAEGQILKIKTSEVKKNNII